MCELAGHRVERLSELSKLTRAGNGKGLWALARGYAAARFRDSHDGTRDSAGEYCGDCRGEETAERPGGRESEPERPAVGTDRAGRAQEDDGVGPARLGRIQVVASVDRDPSCRTTREQQ